MKKKSNRANRHCSISSRPPATSGCHRTHHMDGVVALPSGSWKWVADASEPSTCPLYGDAGATSTSRSPWKRAPLESRLRFACAQDSSVKDDPPPRRKLVRRSGRTSSRGPLAIDSLQPGATAWFLGDSLSVQHERALACQLWDELAALSPSPVRPVTCAPSDNLVCNAAGGVLHLEVLNASRLAWRRVVNSKSSWCARPHCILVSHGQDVWRTCWVSSGGGCLRKDSPREMALRLLRANLLRRGDVVLLNEGLHLYKLPPAVRLERVRALAAAFSAAGAANSSVGSLAAAREALGVEFLWRETSPQAFPGSSNGSYAGTTVALTTIAAAERRIGAGAHPDMKLDVDAAPASDRCAPVEQPERPEQLRQTIALLEEGAHLPLLRVWDQSVTRAGPAFDPTTSRLLSARSLPLALCLLICL